MRKKFNRKEHCQKIGKKGGISTLKKHGQSHFSKLVKKRWSKKKQNELRKSEPVVQNPAVSA